MIWNWGACSHFIGMADVKRNCYLDGVFLYTEEKQRSVFACAEGRYIIYQSSRYFLTNDNQFDDHNHSLDLTKYYDLCKRYR